MAKELHISFPNIVEPVPWLSSGTDQSPTRETGQSQQFCLYNSEVRLRGWQYLFFMFPCCSFCQVSRRSTSRRLRQLLWGHLRFRSLLWRRYQEHIECNFRFWMRLLCYRGQAIGLPPIILRGYKKIVVTATFLPVIQCIWKLLLPGLRRQLQEMSSCCHRLL